MFGNFTIELVAGGQSLRLSIGSAILKIPHPPRAESAAVMVDRNEIFLWLTLQRLLTLKDGVDIPCRSFASLARCGFRFAGMPTFYTRCSGPVRAAIAVIQLVLPQAERTPTLHGCSAEALCGRVYQDAAWKLTLLYQPASYKRLKS